MNGRSGAEAHFVPYSALYERPRITWPDSKPLAVTVFLHLDSWQADPEIEADLGSDPRFNELLGGVSVDHVTHSWYEYGMRIGLYRVLELLDKLSLRVTVAVDRDTCMRHPEVIRSLAGRGYEIAAHGVAANRLITSRLDSPREAAIVDQCIDAVARVSGTAPAGWVGQGFSESAYTPALLAARGMRYMVGWANDEQPLRMTAGEGIVSIPYQSEFDDVELLYHRKLFAWEYPPILLRAIERLAIDGATNGRMMGIHVHPWVFGKPHNIAYLESVLTAVAASEYVWHATAREITDLVE